MSSKEEAEVIEYLRTLTSGQIKDLLRKLAQR